MVCTLKTEWIFDIDNYFERKKTFRSNFISDWEFFGKLCDVIGK